MMRRICLLIIAATLMPAAVVASTTCSSPEACVAAVVRGEDPRVGATLERIPGMGAKLLALRSYLLAGAALAQRWSWSQAQIEAFAGSEHQRQLNAAISAVRVVTPIDVTART